MSDYSELKMIAGACQQHQPLRFMPSHGALYIRNDNGIVFDVHQNRSFPEFMAQNKDYADLVLAANPAAVLALIAENERLKKFEDWFSRLETATTAIDESFRDERDLALFNVFWAARLFMAPTEVIESGDEDYCEKIIRSGAETLMVGGRRLRDAAEKDEKGKPIIPFDWQYRSARELAQ